ncbi:5-methylcytosine-specific restriction protein B [Paracoccus pantotrophus]|uniref:5-methylcytosine-specific restriction protein B n=1 Tax=Paracoccus pantotrophus TaxID=82367 RepID=A0AAE6NZV9_PARPN|nr:AAA family ATPase [Paracoccus pantotrophus]QFG38482.1 AAA domain-containing protein [Paracoccus pantotrophus]RKS50989.1 5-methylcytosine-specific restriction protein B [Paracoccus pantotrophus]
MTKEHEFKTWLEQGGAQTEAGRNSRAYAIRTIERNLSALGMPHRDLDEAWEADRFEALRERLRKIREDARTGGQDYRILMPDSDNPHNRLSNWGSWLGQYGRFLAGDPPGAAKDADRIRQYILEHYIEPAREEGRDHVDVLVRDVNEALGLKEAWPNICQALAGRIFQDMAQLPEPERIGADQSSATVFRFKLDETVQSDGSRPFVLFDATGAPFQPVRNYNRSSGVSAFRIKPRGAGNKADEAIETEDIVDVARAMLVDGLASRVKAIAGGPVNYLTYGGDKLVRYELSPEIAQAIGVPPRGGVNGTSSADDGRATDAKIQKGFTPMNLILYGPPGTGKTFSTAAEAVRLCGEPVPQDRAELMAVYQRLVAAGRVEFVTFHQSMAYEDFVEGRQPMTGADGEGEAESAGFRLETVHGIFRRIAKRAETSRGRSSGDDMIRLEDRQVFKMSIGEANNPEDAHLFEEAIEGGYTLLGFDDIDWSDEKYASREAIFEACKDHRDGSGDIDSRSGWVQMPFRFRNWVRHGDIVIVSKGNQQFRAIGEFVGDYEFKPRPEGGYAHRRAVRWLWLDRDGVAVSEIYSRGFMQQSIYLLYDSELNIPALERYMNSQRNDGGDEPDQFVLIIDEINRANISKVFGELITLLEADKRLNQPNAVRVRLPYSGDEFGVPSNLHILGTMNTADRSIALLDTALRRRFTFREMMPDASILEDAGQKCGIDLPRLLATINERIEYLYDREHQIGHAYFTACSSRADVDEVMRHKVIPLLAEYFFEDWAKIAAVLGDLEPGEGSITGGFLKRAILKPPPGLEDGDAVARFRWQVRSVDEGFDYSKLVGT